MLFNFKFMFAYFIFYRLFFFVLSSYLIFIIFFSAKRDIYVKGHDNAFLGFVWKSVLERISFEKYIGGICFIIKESYGLECWIQNMVGGGTGMRIEGIP